MKRINFTTRVLLIALMVCISGVVYSQSQPKKVQPAKKLVVDQFPIRKFWDEAFAASKLSGRPVLVFNVDYIDSPSISFRDNILRIKKVQDYLNETFELAVNDFATDPPPTVGWDSLRNLGLRLDHIEKGYLVAVRPTALLLRPDGLEIDRISHPEKMTPDEFIRKLKDYLDGKGTLEAVRKQFWSDTTKMDVRFRYIEKLVERSVYDSTIRHLGVVAEDKQYEALAKESRKSLAEMRFSTERNPKYLAKWITTVSKKDKADSLDMLNAHYAILEFWQREKKADSLIVWYEKVFAFTGVREADLLNNYAWDVVSYSTKYDTAMALIKEAISKDPDEPNYYDTKALIHFKKYEGKLAVEASEMALALAPSGENAYFADRVRYYKKEFEFEELEKQDKEQK
ncbi:MAG TPA: hypothetical protein VIX80_08595 [Candidatus Kapabacteria bacterium]